MPNIFLIYSRSLSLTAVKPQAYEILMSKSRKTLTPKGFKTSQYKDTIMKKKRNWLEKFEKDLGVSACFCPIKAWLSYTQSQTYLKEEGY